MDPNVHRDAAGELPQSGTQPGLLQQRRIDPVGDHAQLLQDGVDLALQVLDVALQLAGAVAQLLREQTETHAQGRQPQRRPVVQLPFQIAAPFPVLTYLPADAVGVGCVRAGECGSEHPTAIVRRIDRHHLIVRGLPRQVRGADPTPGRGSRESEWRRGGLIIS